jgi:hypothetical protein
MIMYAITFTLPPHETDVGGAGARERRRALPRASGISQRGRLIDGRTTRAD